MKWITETAHGKDQLLKPSDIKHIDLGLSYLLDGILFAARLGFIREPKTSISAVYKVTLWDMLSQKWVPIYIDDRVPAKKGDYSSSAGAWTQNLAVAIIIKALAKAIGGSYDKLFFGSAMRVVHWLLGGEIVREEGRVTNHKKILAKMATAEHVYEWGHKNMIYPGGLPDNVDMKWTDHLTGSPPKLVKSMEWTSTYFIMARWEQPVHGLLSGQDYTVFAFEHLMFKCSEGGSTTRRVYAVQLRSPWAKDKEGMQEQKDLHKQHEAVKTMGKGMWTGDLKPSDPLWECRVFREKWHGVIRSANGERDWKELDKYQDNKIAGMFWMPVSEWRKADSITMMKLRPSTWIKHKIEPVSYDQMLKLTGGVCETSTHYAREVREASPTTNLCGDKPKSCAEEIDLHVAAIRVRSSTGVTANAPNPDGGGKTACLWKYQGHTASVKQEGPSGARPAVAPGPPPKPPSGGGVPGARAPVALQPQLAPH